MKKDKAWLKEEIERLSYTPKGLDDSNAVISTNWILNFIEQLNEPEKIMLNDVIARMEELKDGNIEQWIDRILEKFGEQYNNKHYMNGYRQGKLDGSLESEPEKVVIPKFVADWIEELKGERLTLGEVSGDLYSETTSWGAYIKYKVWARENFSIFARAYLDGYEVEKEKLYTVDLPHSYELIKLLHTQTYRIKKYSESGFGDYTTTFTETEIKDYDERYWAFAQEVTE